MKSKSYAQVRTVDVELKTLAKVNLNSLDIKFSEMSEDQIKEKIEQAWVLFLYGRELPEDYEETLTSFEFASVSSQVIPESYTVTSLPVFEEEDNLKKR